MYKQEKHYVQEVTERFVRKKSRPCLSTIEMRKIGHMNVITATETQRQMIPVILNKLHDVKYVRDSTKDMFQKLMLRIWKNDTKL